MTNSGYPTYENRRFTRVTVIRPAQIRTQQGEVLPGQIIEISLAGVRFTLPKVLTPGTACVVNFFVEFDEEVELQVVVVKHEGDIVTAEICGVRRNTFVNLRGLLVENCQSAAIDDEIVSRSELLPELY